MPATIPRPLVAVSECFGLLVALPSLCISSLRETASDYISLLAGPPGPCSSEDSRRIVDVLVQVGSLALVQTSTIVTSCLWEYLSSLFDDLRNTYKLTLTGTKNLLRVCVVLCTDDPGSSTPTCLPQCLSCDSHCSSSACAGPSGGVVSPRQSRTKEGEGTTVVWEKKPKNKGEGVGKSWDTHLAEREKKPKTKVVGAGMALLMVSVVTLFRPNAFGWSPPHPRSSFPQPPKARIHFGIRRAGVSRLAGIAMAMTAETWRTRLPGRLLRRCYAGKAFTHIPDRRG